MRAMVIAALLAAACSSKGATTDAGPQACRASGGCATGPACGGGCCGQGEQCVAGTCMCGTKPACSGGDMCQLGIPKPEQTCGVICCGVSQICPR